MGNDTSSQRHMERESQGEQRAECARCGYPAHYRRAHTSRWTTTALCQRVFLAMETPWLQLRACWKCWRVNCRETALNRWQRRGKYHPVVWMSRGRSHIPSRGPSQWREHSCVLPAFLLIFPFLNWCFLGPFPKQTPCAWIFVSESAENLHLSQNPNK